jgi:retron-type reverse transcriptase
MRYSEVYDFTNLYNAYLLARKQKRYRPEILPFSYNLEPRLIELQNELQTYTYCVGEYRPFIITDPKRRQIVALPFRDRIVQHALHNIVEPPLDRRMIYDSFACRKGKGTHAAAKRLSYFLGKPDNLYYLKMDIKSYFASVNIPILKRILCRYIQDEGITWLLEKILDSPAVSGLPIGNLMSQLFANIYLHELDHHCKNVLSVSYYIRYMDDIIIMAHSKAYLKWLLADIELFLKQHLALTLNEKTSIGKCQDGITFVGYRIWRGYKLIKKHSLQRMKKKFRAWKHGKIDNDRFTASLSSWMGHTLDTASHKIVEQIMLDTIHVLTRRQHE